MDKKAKVRAEKYLASLAKYGIFLVDIGECEQWLKSLEVETGNKSKWLAGILKKLDEGKYKINSKDDVWKFLIKIKKWVNNPNRLGM